MAWARRWWFATVPAAVGLLLAVWGVGTASPWLDEMVTLHALTRGFGVHLGEAPILPYYAVAWLWSGAGTFASIEWVRLLSGLSIAAGSIAVALAGRRMAGTSVGFAAAMFFVVAPGIGRYAQEARVYGLAAALVALATWALVEVLNDGPRRWWVVYGIALGSAGVLLPTSWAVVPAHLAILLGFPHARRHLADWATTLLFLTPILAIDVLLGLRYSPLRSWLARPELTDLPSGLLMPVHAGGTSVAIPLLLVLLGLLTGTGRRWLAGLAVSVVLVWMASQLLGSWWIARSFLPMASVLCIAAALALAKASWPVVGVAIGLVLVLAVPDHLRMRQADARGPDVRTIAAIMDEKGQPGDRRLVAVSDLLDWIVAVDFADDPRGFERTLVPVPGRYWELADEPSCTRYDEWPIPGGATLRLCR